MVHDTGATPTMSPNPHFQRRSRMETEQKDPVASDISMLDSSWDDDGWTSSSATHTDPPPCSTTRPPKKVNKPSLPGISSIPGLALSSMPTNSPTPQSMSTWVESVGKKWGEIRESQTSVFFFIFVSPILIVYLDLPKARNGPPSFYPTFHRA